ncbi:transglutaminase domain-containing protein [Acidaminobacter sp. JC074]|uniref:transglutaminase-like domain-containing protein n=1 Tax=Acidaminobacter sp. JC074 TaxID=2530199 RepID=UPI001F0F7C21|nr:transglutaminase-like domain-containing protein [Acidaminobacter sp. JC074]MCH4890320.1 transglutaminase domain-containing protein [Acidaminobacter sp. JC074]
MLRKSLIMFCIFTMMLSVAAFADNSYYSLDESENGIVIISYPVESDIRYKVMLKKDNQKYYYDMIENEVRLPLQMGEGIYELAILKNQAGTTYTYEYETTFKVDEVNEEALYLADTVNVDWSYDHEAIVFLEQLILEDASNLETVESVHSYLVENLFYDYNKFDNIKGAYLPDIDETFSSQYGICYDFSALFAAMLRSEGIQTKLVMGYRADTPVYHAWNEVYLDGQWLIVDITLDVEYRVKGFAYEQFKDEMFYSKDSEY